MAWAKNGTPNTLSGTSDDCDITDLTADKFNLFLHHGLASSAIQGNITTDNNGNTDYAYRISRDGAADFTGTSVTSINVSKSDASDVFMIAYVTNIDSEEKLFICQTAGQEAAGAGTAPYRQEHVNKVDTSTNTGQFTRIDFENQGAGNYDTGSNLSAIGSELTPASATSIETGSIYIDTDTASRWWYDGTYWNMQPTFENLFSTDNMTHNTSQTAIESGYFRVNHRVGSGADDHAYWDLGTTLSDNWVMRCKFSCTAKSSSASNPNTVGLFSLSASNDNDFSVNGLGFKVSIGGGGNYDNLFFNGGTSNQSGGEGYNFSGVSDFDNINNAGTTKYVEIIKNGTSITMNVYDDEYVTLYDTFTTTHTGTMTGLRYFTYKNRDDIAGSHTETIHIDDLRIYNGVTSVQQ